MDTQERFTPIQPETTTSFSVDLALAMAKRANAVTPTTFPARKALPLMICTRCATKLAATTWRIENIKPLISMLNIDDRST